MPLVRREGAAAPPPQASGRPPATARAPAMRSSRSAHRSATARAPTARAPRASPSRTPSPRTPRRAAPPHACARRCRPCARSTTSCCTRWASASPSSTRPWRTPRTPTTAAAVGPSCSSSPTQCGLTARPRPGPRASPCQNEHFGRRRARVQAPYPAQQLYVVAIAHGFDLRDVPRLQNAAAHPIYHLRALWRTWHRPVNIYVLWAGMVRSAGAALGLGMRDERVERRAKHATPPSRTAHRGPAWPRGAMTSSTLRQFQ
mmetsp:Transcript_21601/g.72664  ORF Transcript_21601/g.72664 Transcript_21601/m.72664 type:complete len:259 (-) Transcript_21601:123-899(-)